jgi:NADP-dependent 3-hydroxy acid dehydrogenase YdfG
MWHQWPTEDHSLEHLEQLLATNVFGTMWMINKIFPLMKKQKNWIIFTTNSLAWVEWHKDRSPYCASKRALTWYLKYFREEAAEYGIKVMQIHPGGMNTSLFDKFDDRTWQQAWKMDKDHVADVIVFMLSQPDDMSLETVVVRKFLK